MLKCAAVTLAVLVLTALFVDTVAPQEQAQQEQKPGQTKEESEKTLPQVHEEIVVTATRIEQPIGETISLATVISGESLAEAPTLALDDSLRRVPGFSLFRRSSSLVAHPTTQGVSLRGIGPSGTSRSLVLFDGIPLNDPYGGWVYWDRIPQLSLRSAEVVRGATSALYGSSALGGTIQFLPREPEKDVLELRGQFGTHESYEVEALASDRLGDWGYLVSGRLFNTDGFYVLDEKTRGAIDTRARSAHQTFAGRVKYKNFHTGVNLFHEDRDNGTQIQENRSHFEMWNAGYRADRWDAQVYAQTGRFESTFSRILPDRSQEFLTLQQNIASTGLGGAATFRPGFGKASPAFARLLLGADWRYVNAENHTQNLAGVFVQDLFTVGRRLDVLAGIRFDLWQNQATEGSVNPRAGILYRASNALTVRASGYRGFRAPTLNELYRPFRVGNVNTLANPDLDEEHLWGTEAGVDIHPVGGVLLRLNGFWNSLRDPVSNVTLSTTPALITRQRQNLGRASVRGLEAESTIRIQERWELRTAYLYSRSEVRQTGLRLPQTPLHQGTIGLEYRGSIIASIDARFVSEQFDDDLNTLPLKGFGVVDLAVRRAVSRHFDLVVVVENLLDQSYPVQRTPVVTYGTPRLVHGGIQFRLGP